MDLFNNYVKGTFAIDLIAVIPYSIFKSEYIFLRFLKIASFDRYLSYFTDTFKELLINILNQEQIKVLISIFKLTF